MTSSHTCPTSGPCEEAPARLTRPGNQRLVTALLLTLGFFVVEVISGFVSGSLALLSDAGHMLADVFAIVLALFAGKLAVLPATPEKSYGYYRLEILSALANGVLLCLVALGICREAWLRLAEPQPIETGMMIAVAVIGLGVNLVAAKILHRHDGHIHLRAAYLHVLGDILSSIGVIIGGVLVAIFGDTRIDAVLAAMIGIIVLWTAQRLVRDAVDVLLEAIPKHLEPPDVQRAILATPGVVGLHDLHIWSLTTGVEALSAHVIVRPEDLGHSDRILEQLNHELDQHFRIAHTTIQIEPLAAPLARPAPADRSPQPTDGSMV